jgi:hypothetical protein
VSRIHAIVLKHAGFQAASIIYWPSVILTYHFLTQVKLGSKNKEDENMVNSIVRYLKLYSTVTNVNLFMVILPAWSVVAY